jgi:hypothetical protein
MKILISEAQYNRILIENSFELTEGGRGHYEDRKKRIQETLDVVFEYGGPKNLIQTFGDSIPKLWNPDTTTLEKFVKPSSKMALGDSYVVGKFKVGDDEYKSILDRLEFLEKNFKKFLNHKSEDKFIIRIYEYNLNPSTTKGQQSNFDRIEFSNENVKEFLPTFFKKSDSVNLFIANKPKVGDKDGPSVGDSIIVLLQFDDLDTIINDRSRDQPTKFSDFKIMGFTEFKKEVEKIEKEEEEKRREEEERSMVVSPQFRSDSLEPKVRERAKVAPRTLEGFFKLLPGELESEVKDVYNILSKARESHREIVARYKELGKFGSDDMKSEIAGLGISMYKEKIKSIMSNNISSKFMESFVELFDPKPLVREGFVYVNTEFGVLKLTEGQLESISYLL